ncbi:MAG: RluA family pseudouridine synthase [Syntrophomonadaceae bacterium]
MSGKHELRSAKSKLRRRETRFLASQGAQLMQFLLENLPDQDRNNVKSLLKHRQISVCGQVVTRYDHALQPGDAVTINWSLVRDIGLSGGKGLQIIYEDQDIIVVDKPAGLLSIATATEKQLTAYHQLTDHVRLENPAGRIFIVHRLDRDTSGLMLFAKNEIVKLKLQAAWKEAVVDRAYAALVEGRVEKKSDTVKSWLLTTKTGLMYSASTPGDGQEAVTHYQVLQQSRAYSLLEIRLLTGRKNQIRVHMKDLGHPIAGDRKYGALTNPLGRLALHAHLLSFYHPVSGQLMRFETEIPKAFLRLVK